MNYAAGASVGYEDVVVDLANDVDRLIHKTTRLEGEVARLTFALHRRRAHPDFEYATTQTARKSGDDPLVGLEGDGWEPNEIVECHRYEDGRVIEEQWCNWERFQFHEDNYYRRRKSS